MCRKCLDVNRHTPPSFLILWLRGNRVILLQMNQVVADQIAVIPVGVEKEAKAVNSDLDGGIEKNLDAALIQNRMHDSVKYEVKNGVVTLTGEVNSQQKRDHAEKVATRVPNVKQVVSDLQVKNQKASSIPRKPAFCQ